MKCKRDVARRALDKPRQIESRQTSERSERSGSSERRKGDLRKICGKLIGPNGIGFHSLSNQIQQVSQGQELLEEFNIWGPVDLVRAFPEFRFIHDRQVLVQSPVAPLKPLDVRLMEAYYFCLDQPGRRLSLAQLKQLFGISSVEVQIAVANKEYFVIKSSEQGETELEALPPVFETQMATDADSFEQVRLKSLNGNAI